MENYMLATGWSESIFHPLIIIMGTVLIIFTSFWADDSPLSEPFYPKFSVGVGLALILLILADIFWCSTEWESYEICSIIIINGFIIFILGGLLIGTGWREKFILFPFCVSAAIFIFMIVGALHDGEKTIAAAWKPNEQGPIENLVLKRLADFSTSEGNHIATLIKNLQQSELSLQAKIGELSKTLEAFGRNVDDDREFISWNRKLTALKTDRAQLKEKLEEGFIWSEKFRLTPSAEHEAELSARITECNTLATELAGRYQELFELKSAG